MEMSHLFIRLRTDCACTHRGWRSVHSSALFITSNPTSQPVCSKQQSRTRTTLCPAKPAVIGAGMRSFSQEPPFEQCRPCRGATYRNHVKSHGILHPSHFFRAAASSTWALRGMRMRIIWTRTLACDWSRRDNGAVASALFQGRGRERDERGNFPRALTSNVNYKTSSSFDHVDNSRTIASLPRLFVHRAKSASTY